MPITKRLIRQSPSLAGIFLVYFRLVLQRLPPPLCMYSTGMVLHLWGHSWMYLSFSCKKLRRFWWLLILVASHHPPRRSERHELPSLPPKGTMGPWTVAVVPPKTLLVLHSFELSISISCSSLIWLCSGKLCGSIPPLQCIDIFHVGGRYHYY